MLVAGIDIGKVSLKIVVLEIHNGKWHLQSSYRDNHQGEIAEVFRRFEKILKPAQQVVVTGRHRGLLPYPSVVEKRAQEVAAHFLYPHQPVTIIRLGGGGFSALSIDSEGRTNYRQNPRCAAGVGSFLDQIVSRVNLDIGKASEISRLVEAAEITSRCGVTMKTDFTHLLNSGRRVEEALAGLLESSAKNAVALAWKAGPQKKILIIGGLSQSSRIVETIKKMFSDREVGVPSEALYFEALGAAIIAWQYQNQVLPTLSQKAKREVRHLTSLKDYLSQVTKINRPLLLREKEPTVVGLDIGSTGSKALVFGLLSQEPLYEVYRETRGNPVGAAQDLIGQVLEKFPSDIRGVGCTGSGREIVAALLKASLPEEQRNQIFVLNEIAAHAIGACYYDPEVDTVVDIGGQDAKFIRIQTGRVVDSTMNTVCSAGTGSFLAEQLQLLGIQDIKELGKIALEADKAADLGQHCAVFISEAIDEVKRNNGKLEEIVAGLYYSIVLNYNNRVKGLREYGNKIFLQGKPAENLALACALSAVSGKKVIVPPSPGSMGALGIALLTSRKSGPPLLEQPDLNLATFLESRITDKKEFRCQSKDGCVTGNLCPIQVITVEAKRENIRFFWGGACDKYEKTEHRGLAKAPRPFVEREKLLQELLSQQPSSPPLTIGIPRSLDLEEFLPLSIFFFRELGLGVKIIDSSRLSTFEHGTTICQTLYCAPMHFLFGQSYLLLKEVDYLFLPKVIEITRTQNEKKTFVCPLSQGSPDMVGGGKNEKILAPILNFKEGYEKSVSEFIEMAQKIGFPPAKARRAFENALHKQEEFEKECLNIGRQAIDYAREHNLPVVIILGHPYIINSPLLNGGIPETVHQQQAIALPVDCYPLLPETPIFSGMYWGYGQRLLRATYSIRRDPGCYPLWLSVYSCGPDSFLLHFFSYLMEDKPYTILESDAYTGQAGFKTRVESFLYGVKNYQEKKNPPTDLRKFREEESIFKAVASHNQAKILIPWMGEGSRMLAALFRSLGVESEAVPVCDREGLELGRRYTSGKECLPMIVTLGSLLRYLQNHPEPLIYFMPRAGGPCRFGQYQLLFQIVLDKLGYSSRVKILSPTTETGYQLAISSAMVAKGWSSIVFSDLLKDTLLSIRPLEAIPGSTDKIFQKYLARAEEIMINTPNNWRGLPNLWGFIPLSRQAVEEFQSIPLDPAKSGKKTVLVTGEIYVRLDSFANDWVVEKLENLGLKVKLAPVREWMNYANYLRWKRLSPDKPNRIKTNLTWWGQRIIEAKIYKIFATGLGWHKDHKVEEILAEAERYLTGLKPQGEAALTIGLPALLWHKKEIAGAVIVGPFECMPTRVGETQLSLFSRQEGLPVLVLSLNGDAMDLDLLENFAWEIHSSTPSSS